ncbi:MAG: sigma-70 family RNA polymerase sigma factor [Phycisphaerae bacterium]|jgi:RNA polymerase sigma-70 factor (ECF subfamily)|nr:sigma-70 family RNA polymerase sigma factor [Phycisphaerae bacterium]
MSEPSSSVTQLLRAASSGERGDVDALLAAIYDDLRRLASHQMRSERDGHTLNPTALANEAYLRLIDQRSTDWRDRLHFFAVAARVIRRILIDHARARDAEKRGGKLVRVPLESMELAAAGIDVDVLAVDEALGELADLDPRQAQIVELRFYGGLSNDEIAEYLAISTRSVDRDWVCAKAWLYCRLGEGGGRG